MSESLFKDDVPRGSKKNPFGEEDMTQTRDAAILRVEQAAVKIRGLRSQLGAEGLTAPATRVLIDEVTVALDAVARALRSGDDA